MSILVRWCYFFWLIFLPIQIFGQVGAKDPSEGNLESEFTFRVPVDVVVVNTIVTDQKGNPVTDLTADHFSIEEDGRRQTIQTFVRESYKSVQVTTPVANSAGNSTVQTQAGNPQNSSATRPRFLSLVIDDVTSPSNGDLYQAVKAIKIFLAGNLEPEDQVSILAASGRFQLTFTKDRDRLSEAILKLPNELNRVRRYTPDCPQITDLQAQRIVNGTDPLALEVAISESILCSEMSMISAGSLTQGGDAPFMRNPNYSTLGISESTTQGQVSAERLVQFYASQIYQENRHSNQQLLRTLTNHLRSLRHFDGRKTMVLFSSGFLPQEFRFEVQQVIDSALGSGVIFNTIDMRGLYTVGYRASDRAAVISSSDYLRPKLGMLQESMQQKSLPLAELAHETGGIFFRNSNDLSEGLKKITEAQSFYYVLTYATPDNKPDGKFHKIKVKINRPDLQITHRKGYFAPSQKRGFTTLKKKEIVEALRAPGNLNEIPVKLSYNYYPINPDTFELDVFTSIDFKGLPFLDEKEFRANLIHLVLVVFDKKNRYVGGQEKALNMKLGEAGYQALLTHGLTSKVTLKVPPGRYQLKAVVRESVDSILGSNVETIEVYRQTKKKKKKRKDPLMAALRSLTPMTQLPLKFRIYTFNETHKQSRVVLAMNVNHAGRELSSHDRLKVMGEARTANGSLASFFSDSVKLASDGGTISFNNNLKLAPGNYLLKLAVMDPRGNVGTAKENVVISRSQPNTLMSSDLLLSQKLIGVPASIFNLQERLTEEIDLLSHNGFQIEPSANFRFKGNAPITVFYRMQNFQSNSQNSKLTARISIINEEGKINEFPPFLLKTGIRPTSDNKATVAFRLPTGSMGPGKYQLIVETRDISTGQSFVARAEGIQILTSDGAQASFNNSQVSAQSLNLPEPTEESLIESTDYLAITQEKNLTEQVRQIEAFLTKYPDSDRVISLSKMAALIYWRLRKFDKVIEHGENILAFRSSNPQALMILASAHHLLGHPVKVIRSASKAIRSLRSLDKPDYLDENRWKSQIDDLIASNYAYMGSAYFSQYELNRVKPSHDVGLNLDKAYTYSSLAVKLDPKSDFALFHLGLVFCARNRFDEALHSLARAVVLKGAFVNIAKENLESVYKSINQGSAEGLGEVLEKARIDLAMEMPPSLLK